MRAPLKSIVATLTTLGLILGGAASASATDGDSNSYMITKYDGTIYEVSSSGARPLSFAEWQALGAPTPGPAPTEYVKYAWSPAISAVTYFGADQSQWVWGHLTAAQWRKAGNPKPRSAGWISGSRYYQWAGSSQIFVQDVGGTKHALTLREWQASGLQPFEKRSNQGFVKLSWNHNIAFLDDFRHGLGSPISASRWRAEGTPTPTVAARFPGDQVYQNYGNPTLYYAGPTVFKALTYAEWRAMGFPTPTVKGKPQGPGRDKDCADYPSQRAAQEDYDRYFDAYGDVYRLDRDGDGVACESYFG